MQIQNIKVLDQVGNDDWRADFNGEADKHCTVNCERCGSDEEDVRSMFKFTYDKSAVLLLCNSCLTEMRDLFTSALEQK